MALANRTAGGTGRFLEWKVRLFFAAAALLFVGMARNIDLLVAIAIVLLGVAFVLRFFEKAPPPEADANPDDEDAEPGE